MKNQQQRPNLPAAAQPVPRSRALIAVPMTAPRRGLFATLLRAAVLILLLPVKIPVLALVGLAKGALCVARGAGRALAAVGRGALWLLVGIARLVAAPFVLGARLLKGIARLLAAGLRGGAKGVAWLLLLPVRIVVLLARGLALLAKGLARALVFVLRLPYVALRGVAAVLGAIAVPVGAVAWGGVRSLGAGVAAVARGVGIALAFLGRLLLRGVALVGRGVFATIAALAIGIYVCLRWTVRLAFKLALLPFVAIRVLAVALARGVRNGAALLLHAGVVVGVGLSEIARALVALARAAADAAGRAARPAAAALATREPQKAILLPLGTLAAIGAVELLRPGAFPFATCAMLIVGACGLLALLSRPTSVLGVLLAWALAVGCGWRAENVGLETPAWLDALVYLAALAALRSAYVAARAFVKEVPAVPRAPSQERAHRRASRAIGIVLAAQCAAFAVWSAADGQFHDAPLYGELLLVGAGMALAWVVRSGHYVRTAQFALTLAALGALVVTLAAQFHAFAAGQLVTAASLGAGVLLLLVAAGLTVVVHTRLIDSEQGA